MRGRHDLWLIADRRSWPLPVGECNECMGVRPGRASAGGMGRCAGQGDAAQGRTRRGTAGAGTPPPLNPHQKSWAKRALIGVAGSVTSLLLTCDGGRGRAQGVRRGTRLARAFDGRRAQAGRRRHGRTRRMLCSRPVSSAARHHTHHRKGVVESEGGRQRVQVSRRRHRRERQGLQAGAQRPPPCWAACHGAWRLPQAVPSSV